MPGAEYAPAPLTGRYASVVTTAVSARRSCDTWSGRARPRDDAMNDDGDETSGSRIDLASIPEPVRSMLLKHLDKMSPAMREKLLREGSPVLDRMIAKARENADAV